MGFDVTYHPVSEFSLDHFYFSLLSGQASVAERCFQYGIDPIFEEKLTSWVRNDRMLPPGSSFDATIGYHAAAAAGIFARFHYLRGSQLSQLPTIHRYTKPWQQIAPEHVDGLAVTNRITENYMSGVFVPADRIAQLRHDVHQDPELRSAVERQFPERHLGVLLAAMDEAIEIGVGLLEATDVLEPHPFDLNATIGAANRLNCDPTGALIYRDTALAQISHDPKLLDAVAEGRVARMTTIVERGAPGGGESVEPHVPVRGLDDRPSTPMLLLVACLVAMAVLLTLKSNGTDGPRDINEAPFSDEADCVNIRTEENPFWHCTPKGTITN